jgi:hypothetical protein
VVVIYAVAAAGGVALLAVVALAFKLASASSAARSATSKAAATEKLLADLTVSTGATIAQVIKERDVAIERGGKLAAEVADLTKLNVAVTEQRDELAAKLSKAIVERLKNTPVSEDGAAIVNDLFSTPILPGGKL